MLAGELYRADSPELIADNRRISAWMERFNATGVRSHYSDRFRQWGYDLPASIYEPII